MMNTRYLLTLDLRHFDHVEDKTNVRLDMHLINFMHLIPSANPCIIILLFYYS